MYELSSISLWPPACVSPEIPDGLLSAVPAHNLRVKVENLLRRHRVPACCLELYAVEDMIQQRLADVNRFAPSLDDHIQRQEKAKEWRALDAVVKEQLAWHMRQVKVERDEINALVTRWLLLNYGGNHARP
jgi:hypothetical protein